MKLDAREVSIMNFTIMARRTLQASKSLSKGIKIFLHKFQVQGHLLKSHRQYSNETYKNRILSLSSILLQDGLDITELPIFIRKMDLTSFPYERTEFLPAVKKMTEEEKSFRAQLQMCSSVKEVFQHLEVPSDVITGYTAAFALQKICHLQRNSNIEEGIDSFIQTAVMNELYEIVKKEVTILSNETLLCLVKNTFQPINTNVCFQFLFEEIERRISDNKFTINEICELSCVSSLLSQSTLVDTCWIHIGNRYEEINEDNCHLVFRCIPSSQKELLKLVQKNFFSCWWKLKSADIASIVLDMIRLKLNNIKMLQHIGKWTFMNINAVNDAHLTQVVAGFVHFHYTDSNLIKSVERYIPAKIEKIDRNLLALVMEYCRSQRYLSTHIFDMAASDFIKNGHDYTCLQVYSVLRPFGQLNYQPLEATQLFLKAEEVLQRNLSEFAIPNLVELLCSFAFMQRFPINFSHLILTPSFLSRIKGISNDKLQMTVGKWLEMFQSALLLETKHRNIPHLFKMDRRTKIPLTSKFHREVFKILAHVFGADKVDYGKMALKTVYIIDFVINLNKMSEPMSIHSQSTEINSRIAIVLHQPEHLCSNSGHLMGEPAMKVRHLKLLGYKVVEVQCVLLNVSTSQQTKYLYSLLEKYIPKDRFLFDKITQL